MSGWRQVARELKEAESSQAKNVAVRSDLPPAGSGIGASSHPATAPTDPVGWERALTRLDANRPPIGFDPDRWPYLLTDARWLCNEHGAAAHCMGWTASDLFGIGLAPGWGGVADRLEGARILMMTTRIAHWRGAEVEGWLWRETMRTLPLLWEIAR